MHTEMIRAADLTAAHIGATIDAKVEGLVPDRFAGVIEQFTVSERHVCVRVASIYDDRGALVAPDYEQEFLHDDRISVTGVHKPSMPRPVFAGPSMRTRRALETITDTRRIKPDEKD